MSEEVSRRWVLQLGAGVVLSGFSGAPAAGQTLPPGLYLPVENHLAHVIKAAALARPLANYQPQFFKPAELDVVRRMVLQTLGDIPNAPDVVREIVNWIDLTVFDSAAVRAQALALSPAHRALAVQHQGADAVRQLETVEPQRICRDGLAATSGESEAARKFADYIRARAIDGYYTSKEGLRELDYRGNSFYSESPGCTH